MRKIIKRNLSRLSMRTQFVSSLILCVFCLAVKSYGQTSVNGLTNFTTLTQLLPPSPDAASLGKYGNVEINLSSGMLNLSVPLLEYTSTNLKVPVSLSYSSNGIRVDEVASKAGMSWVLNAGGVITRTILGAPDENKTRIKLPASYPQKTQELLTFLDGASITGDNNPSFDVQPDLFTFNFDGYAGKFILDSSLNTAILLSHSGLKIDCNLKNGFTSGWHFKITTPEGVQYLFGGTVLDRAQSWTMGADANHQFFSNSPTAFYLTSIVHPNHDTVYLKYGGAFYNYYSSTSETLLARDTRQVAGICACYELGGPTVPNTNPRTVNYVQSSNAHIEEISSTSGGTIKFKYIDRKDVGDQLLSKIEVYQPGKDSAYKAFDFAYQYAFAQDNTYANDYITDSSYYYRPFLAGITEHSSGSDSGVAVKKHVFKYNDIHALPPRLSFAQDHYGFFNGKHNNTLIPPPEDTYWRTIMPEANADRNVDSNFSFKGLLTNITYPTGGQDSIVYEPNIVFGRKDIYPPQKTSYLSAAGASRWGTEVYDTITVAWGQQVAISVNCSYNGTPEAFDAIHDKASINFLNITDPGAAGNFSENLDANTSYTQVVSLLPGNTYVISLRASGLDVAAMSSLTYYKDSIIAKDTNQLAGGARVKRIITKDIYGLASVKRYYYNKLGSFDTSSAIFIARPRYDKLQKMVQRCVDGVQRSYSGNCVECTVISYDFPTMYSNTQVNIAAYGGNSVVYRAVTESLGENFENGGVEHYYQTAADERAANIMGEEVLGAPMTSNSWNNGQELYSHYFKKTSTGLQSVKKVFTHYRADERVDSSYRGYLVNKRYVSPCAYLSEEGSAPYDLQLYLHFQKWLYPDSVRTIIYNPDGVGTIENTVSYEYQNPSHALVTRTITNTSENGKQVAQSYYPQDTLLAGDEELARQSLVAQHILSPVIRQVVTKNGAVVFKASSGYHIFPNGLTLLQTQSVQMGTAPVEERIRIYRYNDVGKVLEHSKANDVHKTYLWGYNNMYPVAEATGISHDSLALYVNQNILDHPTSDGQLRDELNALRVRFPKALLTSLTYAPLIGQTSQTDVNNRTSYFEYDGLGRLKLIKDLDGNILKTYDYHYKTN